MVAPHRQQSFQKILVQAAKVPVEDIPPDLSVLDHLLIGILQEGTTFARALAVYRSLQASFLDFNELRVSHRKELADYLRELPNPEDKARRIIAILQFVFETTYAFDLESMRRKPLKQAQKQLSKMTGASPFTVSCAVQRALGGHSLPLDEAMLEVLRRADLVGNEDPIDQVRVSLEHLVPKAQGISFSLLLSNLAADGKRCQQWMQQVLGKSRTRPAPTNDTSKKVAANRAAPAKKSSRGKK